MKNLIKTGFYAWIGTLLIWLNAVNADIDVWTVSNQGLVESWEVDDVVQWYIVNAMSFLYLVAVVYGLWGGFNILTAGGDEEKVKKWKTVLIQTGIWLVVIFLAGTIVEWLIGAILV